MKRVGGLAVIACAVALAACGGDDDDTAGPDEPPATVEAEPAESSANAALESDIQGTQNRDQVASRKATAVECPDDFVERPGESTSCEVSLADGSTITYTVLVSRSRVTWFVDPAPPEDVEQEIVDGWNEQGPPLAEGAECPDSLPAVLEESMTCSLTTRDGRTTEAEVTVTNRFGDFNIDYGPLR